MKITISKRNTTNITTILSIYLILTMLLYAFGPYEWQTHNTFLTYTLLFVYVFALYAGGKLAQQRVSIERREKLAKSYYYNKVIKLYYLFGIITFVLSIIALKRVISLYGLSGLTELFTRLTENYKSLYFSTETSDSGAEMYGGTWFSLCSLIFSPITILFIPLTITCFKDLSVFQRIFGTITCLLRILSSIAKGSNYSIFQVVVPIFVVFFVLSKRAIRTKKKRGTFWLIIGVTTILYLFFAVMDNRMGGRLTFMQIGENKVNYNHVLLYLQRAENHIRLRAQPVTVTRLQRSLDTK